MSKFNYATTRNKQKTKYYVTGKPVVCQLNNSEIKELNIRERYLNDWQKNFMISIKSKNYKIVSGKQFEVIKNILKIKVNGK